MNDLMMLLHDLGKDAILLTRKDKWLEQQRRILSTEIDGLISELRSIQLAQRVKRILQQTNKVAVMKNKRDTDGNLTELGVQISNLPDAIKELEAKSDPQSTLESLAQQVGWESDGYDIEASRNLSRQPL